MSLKPYKVSRSLEPRLFSFRRYIICWGNLSLSKIIGGGGGGGGHPAPPHRRILLFCKYVYNWFPVSAIMTCFLINDIWFNFFLAKINGYKMILKSLILIICVGQLDVFASVFKKEPLSFEFEESSFPESDELVHDEELIERPGKHYTPI